MLLLVVDNHAGVRLMLRELFEAAGYRVALAADGREAVAVAARTLAAGNPPALALVDLQMPEMDGLETTRALKAVLPRLPVLILSAADEQGDPGAMLAAGACGAVTKPFDVFALRERVRKILEEEGSHD